MNTPKKARESRNLSIFNAADYSFVEGAATKENGETGQIAFSGANILEHLPEVVYHMFTGPTEDEVKAKQGAMAALVAKLFYGSDPSRENYDIAVRFINLLRAQVQKVNAGEMTAKQAVHFAHASRKPGKEVVIKMKVSAEEQAILEKIRAEKAAQEKASQQPAAKTAKKAGK